jgi:tape measure domain-containing protein
MNLELFIRLRDMASGGLAKIASTAQATSNKMKGANGTLAQSYDQIKNKINDLESTIRRSTSINHIRAAKKELQELNRMQMRHPGNVGGGGGMGGMLRQVLPMLGVAGVLAMGGKALSSGLEAQSRQTSFEVMAGKEAGTKLNQNLTTYAQDSIYGNEVYKNAQTMMGFGIEAENVMPSLKMLGDVAMGDANRLGNLTLAFSQVRAAGKLTGQDLLQFINAGFNPLQTIAEKTGMSMGELKDKVSQGAISFEMVEEAFKAATSEGGRFNDMTNKISQTDYGKVQAFWGQLSGFFMELGGFIAPVAGMVADFGSELLTAEPGALALAAAIGIAAIALNWAGIALGFAAAKTWLLNIAMSANPVGLVVAGIALLVGGIIYAWNKFEGFRKVVWGLWGAFKQVFENIGSFFKKTFEPIFEAITAFKEGRYLDASKAVAKMAFNLSPVGAAVNAVKFTAEGGLTKGVAEAFAQESLKGIKKNKNTSAESTSGADPASLSNVFGNMSGKGEKVQAGDDSVTKGITSSGPRQITINIDKLVDGITIHAASFEKGLDQTMTTVEDALLRVLNSGASVQG